MDFQFVYKDEDKASGAVLYYYKHRIVLDLDDNIGDIQSAIADRQKALIVELEDEVRILKHTPSNKTLIWMSRKMRL